MSVPISVSLSDPTLFDSDLDPGVSANFFRPNEYLRLLDIVTPMSACNKKLPCEAKPREQYGLRQTIAARGCSAPCSEEREREPPRTARRGRIIPHATGGGRVSADMIDDADANILRVIPEEECVNYIFCTGYDSDIATSFPCTLLA
ncbi:hypothetical protein EVAR_103441_1 [Eumeta japonica]|uniref:Uncharacterized protein n=1 Tax=Eumeta variegata TaxID=151549 RepID=A0A4C1Z1N9_EUMVA|nr:hypothetical protein EVAR_103441_1 [Eumeta japonica]